MTIILDENLPRGLARVLAPHVVTTVQLAGLAGTKNGELLKAMEGAFDLFITGDKNLRHQQRLAGRQLAIMELPSNRWPILRALIPQILKAIDHSQPASYTVVSFR